MAEGSREPSWAIPRSRCPAARAVIWPHRCRPDFHGLGYGRDVADRLIFGVFTVTLSARIERKSSKCPVSRVSC
jgi:hypothetical protein